MTRLVIALTSPASINSTRESTVKPRAINVASVQPFGLAARIVTRFAVSNLPAACRPASRAGTLPDSRRGRLPSTAPSLRRRTGGSPEPGPEGTRSRHEARPSPRRCAKSGRVDGLTHARRPAARGATGDDRTLPPSPMRSCAMSSRLAAQWGAAVSGAAAHQLLQVGGDGSQSCIHFGLQPGHCFSIPGSRQARKRWFNRKAAP
jgi:hypothetical protein